MPGGLPKGTSVYQCVVGESQGVHPRPSLGFPERIRGRNLGENPWSTPKGLPGETRKTREPPGSPRMVVGSSGGGQVAVIGRQGNRYGLPIQSQGDYEGS